MWPEQLPAGIHFITKAKPAQVIPIISEFLQRHSDDKPLIILDTLGKARPPRPPGADMYAWDYSIGSQLKDTIDTTPGASLLTVHHTRKQESSDFVDSVSGSQGIAGSADFVLVLSRKRHSDEAVLSVTGRDIAEGEYALNTDGGLWRLDGGSLLDAAKTAETRRDKQGLGDRALEVLAFVNANAGTRASDVAEELGMIPEQARVYLNRLASSGRISKLGRGLFNGVMSVMSVMSDENGQVTASENDENITDITLITLPYGMKNHDRRVLASRPRLQRVLDQLAGPHPQ
jgi:hypothetical protein